MIEGERADFTSSSRARVGEQLRLAREHAGLTLADIAQRTRVPQRHLESIEDGTYSTLPSITYAMGFMKAYARTVGLDEVALGKSLRAELGSSFDARPEHVPYETVDPTRVPSRALAWVAGVAALVLVIGLGVWYGSGWWRSFPPAAPAATIGAPAALPAAARPSAAPAPVAGEQVTLTAKGEVWVRIYDASNITLLLKTMQPGERFDVPRDAKDPKINVGRPGQLDVTINGSQVAPLGPPERAIKDVPVSAAALRARATPPAAP